MGAACCACHASNDGRRAPTKNTGATLPNNGLRHPRQWGGGHRPQRSDNDDSRMSESQPRVMHSSISFWPPTRLAPGYAEEVKEEVEPHPQCLAGVPATIPAPSQISAEAPNGRRSISFRSDSDSRLGSTTGTELPHAGTTRRGHLQCDETIEPPADAPAFGRELDDRAFNDSGETMCDVRSDTLAPDASRDATPDALVGAHREASGSVPLRKVTSTSTAWARSTASDLAGQMLNGGLGITLETDAFGDDGSRRGQQVSDVGVRARLSCEQRSSSITKTSTTRASSRTASLSVDGKQPLFEILVPPSTAVASLPVPAAHRPSISSAPRASSDAPIRSHETTVNPAADTMQHMLLFDAITVDPTPHGMLNHQEKLNSGTAHNSKSDARAYVTVRPLASDSEDELLVSAIASAGLATSAISPQPFSPVKTYVMAVAGYQPQDAGDAEEEDPTSPVMRTSTMSSCRLTAHPPLSCNPLHGKGAYSGNASGYITSSGSQRDIAPPSMISVVLAAGSDAPQPPRSTNLPKLSLARFPSRRSHDAAGGLVENNTDLGSSWEHGSLSLNPFQPHTGHCVTASTSQSCNLDAVSTTR
jgi:hypothetical protein